MGEKVQLKFKGNGRIKVAHVGFFAFAFLIVLFKTHNMNFCLHHQIYFHEYDFGFRAKR
jgi:hypothetical protein